MTAQPHTIRREGVEPATDRTYTVEPDFSLLRGCREQVWRLRCYGVGTCTIGEGRRCTFSDAFTAHRVGQVWTDTGVSPAAQVAK